MLRSWSLASVLLLASPAVAQLGLGGQQWNVRDQVNFQSFRSGFQSQIKTQEMIEISSENDFQRYWTQAFGQPGENAPKGVDWRKEKLLAIHLGTRKTTGYSVMVQNVERKGSFALVTALETQPSKNQVTAPSITTPYTIVKVDRLAVPFRLEIKTREGLQIPGGQVIITDPGTAVISPDFERPGGGGYVDPKLQVEWQNYGSLTRSNATQQGLNVMNTSSQWHLYWSQLTGESPAFAPDNVDWFREQLIVITLGPRPTTGYSVKVVSVERTKPGGGSVIRALEEQPVPGSTVRRRKTSPFVVIRVRRNSGPFTLDLTQRERGPGNVRIIEDDGRGD